MCKCESQSNYIACLSPSSKSIHYANYNVAPHDGSPTLDYYCKEIKKGHCAISSISSTPAGTQTSCPDVHVIGEEMHNACPSGSKQVPARRYRPPLRNDTWYSFRFFFFFFFFSGVGEPADDRGSAGGRNFSKGGGGLGGRGG